jgi:hypothetical protein
MDDTGEYVGCICCHQADVIITELSLVQSVELPYPSATEAAYKCLYTSEDKLIKT